MPIVERFFTQVHPEPESFRDTPKPLLDFRAHHAIIVLGDPGSGKTASFHKAAVAEPNSVFVPVRDFLASQANQWEGKTLYLDGLDEQRSKTEDGR
jgi:hypothetical protein